MAKRFGYSKMQGTATRLMDKFQQGVVTLIRPGEMGEPPNEWTPGEMGEDQVYPLKATVAAVTVDQANAKYIDGTLITSADLVATIAVPPITPLMSDLLTIDGVPIAIKKIIQVPSAGEPVVFKLFLQG